MKNTFLCAAVVILGCSFTLGQQRYKLLWSFEGLPSDGANPSGELISDHDGNLYGTTKSGGLNAPCDCGTVFELSPNSDDTWAEAILYSFCENDINGQCLDGAGPRAGLVFDNQGNLYGTTYTGGNEICPGDVDGCGTVFKLSPPSPPGQLWSEVILYNFCSNYAGSTCLDGAWPSSQLTFDATGNLFGTTNSGGSGGTGGFAGGTVFELSPRANGWAETVLYNFCSNDGGSCPDGAFPAAGVTFDKSGNLYGATEVGGHPDPHSPGGGVVYELSPGLDGWTETLLYSSRPPFPNGANPVAAVIFDAEGNLYGTASDGGPGGLNGFGGVFELRPSGAGRRFLFNGGNGGGPTGRLLLDSKHGVLYGTTAVGGANSEIGGTAFKIVAPGEETVLYSFCARPDCTDGVGPEAGMIEDESGHLYGTALGGGADNKGVVYEITP